MNALPDRGRTLEEKPPSTSAQPPVAAAGALFAANAVNGSGVMMA
jgi:hypothetical protein